MRMKTKDKRRGKWAWMLKPLPAWYYLLILWLAMVSRPAAALSFEHTSEDGRAFSEFAVLFAGSPETRTAIESLLERKRLDPVKFFAHWADYSLHTVFADLDNDGQLDAAFGGELSGLTHKIEIWHRKGLGWQDPVFLDDFYSGAHLSAGDINNDGFIDLITTEPRSHLVTSAWLGSPSGAFTPCTDLPSVFFSRGPAQIIPSIIFLGAAGLPPRLGAATLRACDRWMLLAPSNLPGFFPSLEIHDPRLGFALWGRSPPCELAAFAVRLQRRLLR